MHCISVLMLFTKVEYKIYKEKVRTMDEEKAKTLKGQNYDTIKIAEVIIITF